MKIKKYFAEIGLSDSLKTDYKLHTLQHTILGVLRREDIKDQNTLM